MSTEIQNSPQQSEQAEKPKALLKALSIVAGVAVLAIVAVIVSGISSRRVEAGKLVRTTQISAPEPVSIVHPQFSATAEELVLPGNMEAYVEAPIYARTHGYLKSWYFDIGARVHQGQLLAEIETPEEDQQLEQAQADLKTAQANMNLAKTTAVRWQSLLKKNAVSTQETDQAVSDFAAKQAAVDSSAANVRRLEQLQAYEKVYAPFDGVITARQTDLGSLIDGGSSPRELFHLAAINKLRVYVPVPEVSAATIHTGEQVELTSDEFPNQVFHGTIVRNSSAIDPASRTLNVEVDVDNPTGKLLPGSYAFVHIKASGTARVLTVPANTLLFRAQGLQVGVVRQGRAELVPITIGRDYGATVEVSSGLQRTDAVILDPSDSLISGAAVKVEKENNQ
ncbi:MAG TPA: efflux RND transporter periplasmic adaptor subunit [Bryobacteraceae bacterium]|nr:efflux RND transporter periplasmic adaptor subunit [Bryobacteraceae bacterium]